MQPPTSFEIETADGALRFMLTRRDGAVHMVRQQQVPGKGSAKLVLQFKSESELQRFCAEDDMRFAYQIQFDELQRAFRVLMKADQ